MKLFKAVMMSTVLSATGFAHGADLVAVSGNNLQEAISNYAAATDQTRVDCDQDGGVYVCASFNNPVLSDVDSTVVLAPDPEPISEHIPVSSPSIDTGRVAVTGNTLAEARNAFAAATNLPRVDCDSIGSTWICSSFPNPTLADADGGVLVAEPEPEQANNSGLLFSTNFENGQIPNGIGWTSLGVDNSDRRKVVQMSDGNWAIRHTEIEGDVSEAGASRTESDTMGLQNSKSRSGEERYYGLSVYFPYTWEFDDKWDDIILQIKHFSNPPSMFAVQKYNKLYMRMSSPYNGNIRYEISDGPLERGIWQHIMIRAKWSTENNNTGFVEVRHKVGSNGSWRTAFTHTGPNAYNNDSYLKFGIYKPQMAQSPVDKREIYHDNLKVGTSWEAVDPTN